MAGRISTIPYHHVALVWLISWHEYHCQCCHSVNCAMLNTEDHLMMMGARMNVGQRLHDGLQVQVQDKRSVSSLAACARSARTT
ncbi:hypothetical protein BC628DRAFT_1383422 [Trametes gibbosa]|nr:hypothetical protein BC628DRAFT_1383422 [Trametes gibbosa]